MATDEFFLHPGNPLPATGQCGLVTASDGVTLRVGTWKPTGKISRGTVLVINGRAEFMERWFETIQELRRRGFHVVSFDWRGQGGSDRLLGNPRKGHVRRFADYRRDLAAIFAGPMQAMPRPHFGLAHSMGAALALEASAMGRLPLARLVAVAPMLGLSMVENPRLAKGFAAMLDWLGLGKSFIPGGGATSISTKPFAGNRLTGDVARYARNSELAAAAEHLSIGDPTIRWVHDGFRFMARMGDSNMPLKVSVPVLVIAAGDDPIVATPVVERFASRLKTGSALVIAHSRHEIVMETDAIRAAFWAAFDAFIPGETIRFADAAESSASQQGENLVMTPRVA